MLSRLHMIDNKYFKGTVSEVTVQLLMVTNLEAWSQSPRQVLGTGGRWQGMEREAAQL